MLLATTSKTLVSGKVFCQHKHSQHVTAGIKKSSSLVEKHVEMMGDPTPLQLFLTGFVHISRYYVYILFSRCEHAASLNLQSAAHWGKTVSLCLPARLDSLRLTLCTLLCSFCLPVLVNDVEVRAEGR